MHKILFPILLLSVTFFTSCIDIIETFKKGAVIRGHGGDGRQTVCEC